MLLKSKFEEGLDSIENTYISKKFSVKYNESQYNQWYKILKELTDEAYIKAVDEWCANYSTMPSPADILGMANRLRPQDNSVKMPKNKEKCPHCGDTGFVKFCVKDEKADRYYDYYACCVCEMGEFAHTQYPFPQANRNKLNMMSTIPQPKPKEVKKESIEELVKRFSLEE